MEWKTPGVYIAEQNAFPNSVVEVASAVPAFVGHTEKASHLGQALRGRPWRIGSMADYVDCFGGQAESRFALTPSAGDATAGQPGYQLTRAGTPYALYACMQLFFQNGGGPCYIVSVGDYAEAIGGAALTGGVDALRTEREPTVVVVPEAVMLASEAECVAVQRAVLQHCGVDMKNRFAILDIYQGYLDRAGATDPVASFREHIGNNGLQFAAAYYPWLETTVVDPATLSYRNLDAAGAAVLGELLRADMQKGDLSAAAMVQDALALNATAMTARERDAVHARLSAASPLYRAVLHAMADQLNRLPPSAAIAGVYASVDNARGVWKAPANVAVNAVLAPSVSIGNEQQQDLNVSTDGKSINAIRDFSGEGVLVWGARTLDGNSLDWRYVNVRRTMIMLEESLRLAMAAYVFEPNTANTWVTLKAVASNFLTSIWKRGGLAGAVPGDAFSVNVGLGETMTPEDLLEGRLRLTILVALSRPAEFIEISLQQQMQAA